MIKKLSSLLIFLLLGLSSIAQTIVSTSPENKKVILEEYTGIHCVWCPSGHAIAQAIQNAHPGNVFLINVHVGGYAVPGAGEPDFRTPFGTAIAAEAGVPFYPSGSINRHVFTGSSSAMDRGLWTNAANTYLAQSSYVNVGVEADIDVSNNELTVHMEGYYTGNSPQGSNLLNIALLQNNTKGPQTGGNMGNQYNHMHRLVYLVTGQWGVTLPTTTTGTFVDETYTYTIPAAYNGVPVELADLEVVAFITETHQEIASGSGCFPTFTGITNANDANVRYLEDLADSCSGVVTPKVNIQNLGQNTITSLYITYSINSGTEHTFNWTGEITTLHNETIELPALNYSTLATNVINVHVPNDDDNSNNDTSYSFDQAIDATTTIDMELHTDNWGSEVRWNIKDTDGVTLYNGGPYGNNQTINETFELPQYCYTFNLIDTYGDGGGAVTLTDSDGTQIFHTNGAYGSGESKNFSTDGYVVVVLGINSEEFENLVIYPNPASTVLNIINGENSTMEVYNMLGQILYSKSNISINEQVQVSQFTNGTYFVKITNGSAVKISKFIKK